MLHVDETANGAKSEDLETIVVDDDSENFFQVETQLLPQEKEKPIVFLRRNIDMFAWSAYKALGGI